MTYTNQINTRLINILGEIYMVMHYSAENIITSLILPTGFPPNSTIISPG